MGYYDDEQNVQQYIQMAAGYDGKLLIDILAEYVPAGSRVLELGMGPGKDLLMLAQQYQAIGTDSSAAFLDLFRKDYPGIEVFQMDALAVNTDQQVDGIYSNKVLQHLPRHQLRESLVNQARILNPSGIALHSFWYGDGEDIMHGLHHVYYTEQSLGDHIPEQYEIITLDRYLEMEEHDSIYMVLKKR